MRFALDNTVLLGMGSNQAYLRSLCDDPSVIEGRVHTGYLGEKYADFAPVPSELEFELIQQLRRDGFARSQAAGLGSGTKSEGEFVSPWVI